MSVLFLASLALVMAVYGLAQPSVTARYPGLIVVGAAPFATFTTWVLVRHWATFQRFVSE
ncbi:MAG: hypothetical protein AB7K36_22065 [Chloroflexota bacterium]